MSESELINIEIQCPFCRGYHSVLIDSKEYNVTAACIGQTVKRNS